MSNRSLTELISVRTLEKIQDNFTEATRISCVVRDIKGDTVTKYSNPSRLWLEISKHPDILQQANDNLFKHFEKCIKTGQCEIYERYFDTYTFTVPITINGRIYGFFIGGLARIANPSMENCRIEAKRLGLDLDSFLEMYLELPLINKERLLACANLLKLISSTITTLSKEI